MRAVGLDVGDRRIGVAVSDDLGVTAQPRGVVDVGAGAGAGAGARRDAAVRARAGAGPGAAEAAEIARIVQNVGATWVVAGLPLDSRAEAGRQARRVLGFLERLRAALPAGVAVETWDERFSTAQALRALSEDGRRGARAGRRRRRAVDMVSAALILQSWLDARGSARAAQP